MFTLAGRLGRRSITTKKIAKFFFLNYPFSTCRRTYPKGFTLTSHVHDFPQIWLCLVGEYDYKIGSEIFHCKKGSFLVVPPGVYHSFTAEKSDIELLCIEMSADIFLDCNISEIPNTVLNFLLCPWDENFNCLVNLSESSYNEVMSRIDTLNNDKNAIFKTLEEIFSLPEFKKGEPDTTYLLPVLKALRYINKNFFEKIVISDVLKECALCRTHFLNYFKKFTGTTFSSYLQELRLAYAFVLIGNSDYPISQIATLCGFSDAGYLTNCYKKYVGNAPNSERSFAIKYFSERKRAYMEDKK